MRRLTKYCLIGLSCLLLTGCIKMDVNLVINKDATVSGNMIFAVSDSLASLGNESSEDSNPLKESINTEAEGVTESEYKSGGYTGTKYTFDRVPFDKFNSEGSADEGSLTLVREGNKLTVKGFIDLTSEEADSSSDDLGDWGDAFTKSLTSSFDMNITIKFPVRVIESTGKISDDGLTVTWKPTYGEKLDLTTTVEIPSGVPAPLIVLALALLIGSVSGFVFYKKRRSNLNPIQDQESISK